MNSYGSLKSFLAATLVCIAFPFCARANQGIYPNPSSLFPFGTYEVGTYSPSQQVNLQNGTPYWVSISSITASGDFHQGNNCGSGIAFAQHCTMGVSFSPTTAGYRTGSVVIKYTVPQQSGNTVYTLTMALSGTGIFGGFVNPKYVIASIEYAPPGTSSSASYGNNTVVGNSTTVASSYSNEQNKSVSISIGGAIPGFTTTRTTTYSNSYAQEQDTSSTIAVSQSSSLVTGVDGVETPAGTNHDYDLIRVWLNPVFTFEVDPTTNPTTVVWTGYGFDLNDNATYPYEEVVEVKMGCLNGDIPVSDPNCSYFFGRAQRTWALNSVDGSGPALTGNGAACVPNSKSDICNILGADPFSNPNYTITFNPPSLTTTDGRFTACHDNPNCTQTISAVPGGFTQYSQGYSVTTTQSETAKYTYSQTFAVQDEFKGTGFLNGLSASLASSTKLTWSHSFNQSTNNSQGKTASFTIKPSSGYTGPEGFDVYQDDVFGTFIFWPIPK